MTNFHSTLGGRLALLRPGELSAGQRELYEHIQATELVWANKSGFQAETEGHELIGPFNAMLRSPDIARSVLGVAAAISKHTTLGETVQQVIILTVGAAWQAAYELYAHAAVARKAGLKEETIQTMVAGQSPAELTEKETLARDFTRKLVVNHEVDSDLYWRAIETFGEQGVFDMIALAGQYMTVSALLNAFAVPAPVKTEEGGEENASSN